MRRFEFFLWVGFAWTLLAGCGGHEGANPNQGSGGAKEATGGSGGASGGASEGGSSGGASGSGMDEAGGIPSVDTCVLTSMKVCQSAGCHGGMPISAGLSLEATVLTRDFKVLVDQLNHGDPSGCMAGQFKLIDSTDPAKSLIYAKLPGTDPAPPCGLRMPVIGNFAAADRMCVMSWINSVIAASK